MKTDTYTPQQLGFIPPFRSYIAWAICSTRTANTTHFDKVKIPASHLQTSDAWASEVRAMRHGFLLFLCSILAISPALSAQNQPKL